MIRGLKFTVYCLSLLTLLLTSCSVTSHLPAGEQLYTGIKSLEYVDGDSIEVDDEVYNAIDNALAFPPNNSLLGSSTVRVPLPLGLWVYNSCAGKKGLFRKLTMKLLGSEPVLISTVKPEQRVRLVKSLLHDNGYFAGEANFSIATNRKDSLQAGIHYSITFREPYRLDSIEYRRMQNRSDTLLQLSEAERLLHKGDIFSAQKLEDERERLSNILRNNGYYYFSPDNIVYQADSTLSHRKISLKLGLRQGTQRSVLKPWKCGKTTFIISGYDGETPDDSLNYKDISIYYSGKLLVRPSALYKQLKYNPGDLYVYDRQAATMSALNRLDIFRYVRFRYLPLDSLSACDTLNVMISATCDYPLNGSFDVRTSVNDNSYTGPGASLNLTRRNMFGGGEVLTGSVFASYEWFTGRRTGSDAGYINNYEAGMQATIKYPRLVLPQIGRRAYDFYADTRMELHISILNRAKYYNMLRFGGSLSYDFQPYSIRHHSFTPIRLEFNKLLSTTMRFDSITGYNPSLAQSLEDRFIPAIDYEYTLDNSPRRQDRSKTIWRLSISEAGNLLSAAHALMGKSFTEQKRIFGNTYSQFIKITTELRYNHYISRTRRLATRLGGGVIYSYGNSKIAPYNERFYVGGANSIRAFTIRSIGPGHFTPAHNNPYAYIDQNGDLKLEGNIEYRTVLTGALEAALFLDAGNVWLLRDDPTRPQGVIQLKRLFNDIALGTGFGLRYVLDTLIFRLDAGFALHFPNDTGKRGYFNAPSFGDAIGIHLALGYPF